jgi:hypothetical protein
MTTRAELERHVAGRMIVANTAACIRVCRVRDFIWSTSFPIRAAVVPIRTTWLGRVLDAISASRIESRRLTRTLESLRSFSIHACGNDATILHGTIIKSSD